MSVTSNRSVQIEFSGDVTTQVIQSALENNDSSAIQDIVRILSSLTIPVPYVPFGAGTVVTALTIIPPAGNTILITLKGVGGDTGIPLHLTDPTTIALDTTFTSLVLTAASQMDGIRLIWT